MSLIVYIPPSNKRRVYDVLVVVCIPLSSTSELADPYPSVNVTPLVVNPTQYTQFLVSVIITS